MNEVREAEETVAGEAVPGGDVLTEVEAVIARLQAAPVLAGERLGVLCRVLAASDRLGWWGGGGAPVDAGAHRARRPRR